MLKDLNPEIVERFAQFLEHIVGACFPEKMNEVEKKEAAYLTKYMLERIHEILDQFDTYKKIPLFQVLFLGDSQGKTEIQFRASPEPEFLRGWKLREAAKLIKAATDEWELKYTDPTFEEDWGDNAGPEYQAIKEHVKKEE